MSDIPAYVILLVTLLCYCLAGVLTAGESSLIRLSKATAQNMAEMGRRNGVQVVELMDKKSRVVAASRAARTLLLATSVTGLAVVWLSFFDRWWLASVVTVLMATLLAVFATFPASQVGRRHPEDTINVVAPVMGVIDAMGAPFAKLVEYIKPPSGLTEQEAREEVAQDLREMVDQIGDTEQFEDEDREMLASVLELGQTLVREVMVPRTDMVTSELGQPLDKALSLFVRSGFSRIPVIGEDSDDIRGILFLKDVLSRLHYHPEAGDIEVQALMREATFVPEMKLVDDLLREMQEQRFHMALVVDEYGGIAGLVTLEDLVEEVIGEVSDEHDRSEVESIEVSPGLWHIPAKTSLDDLGELFDLEIEDEDVDTAGGLLTKALGRVPLLGASAQILGLDLEAIEVEDRRRQVSLIAVSLAKPTQDISEGDAPSNVGTQTEDPHSDPQQKTRTQEQSFNE
ncbi:MAG: hemolysin family protein [Actinomycetaceae bacterium]|nr:hemolysin family protein [Actinomycetaceae bacterium]